MASNHPLTLMNVPLEVRHQIFEHVAKRDTKPEKLLRYWFEKKEVKEKTAELLAKNPNAGTPRVVYEGAEFEEDSEEEGDAEHSDEDGEDEDEDEAEDEIEDEEEEGDEDEEDEAEEQDEEMADNDETTAPATAIPTALAPAQASILADTTSQQATTHGQQDPVADSDQTATVINAKQSNPASGHDLSAVTNSAMAAAVFTTNSSTTDVPENASDAPQPPIQDGAKDADVDTDMADDDEVSSGAEDGATEQEGSQMDDDEEEDEENGGNENADGDSDEDMGDEDEEQVNAAGTAQPSPAPVVTAHRKWRHIPKVRMTRSWGVR